MKSEKQASNELLANLPRPCPEIVASPHDYNRDGLFAHSFALLTGRPETSVLGRIRSLAEREMPRMSGRNKYARSIESAVDSIWRSYRDANDYQDTSDPATVISMLEGYHPEIVWAIMIGQRKGRS